MHLVSLEDFLKVCDLSDKASLALLTKNLVPCQIDPERGILVDVDAASTRALISALKREPEALREEEQRLLAEKAARIIRENLDSIVEEAVNIHLNQPPK